MLPHPILASEDDKEFVVRTITNLPQILSKFFSSLEAVYIDCKGSEYRTQAGILYLTVQRQLQILCRIPNNSFRVINSKNKKAKLDKELPKLLNRLGMLFLDNLIGLGPEALSWKRLCLQLAEDCVEHIDHARIVFPMWMKISRELMTMNSPLFIFTNIMYCVLVFLCVCIMMIIACFTPPIRVGIPIGIITAFLLLLVSGIQFINFISSVWSLNILYTRMVELHTINYTDTMCVTPTSEEFLVPSFKKQNAVTQLDISTDNVGTTVTGKHTKGAYYTIPYCNGVGYIDSRRLDEQVVMIAYDKNFRITRWNIAAEELTGFLEKGCIGRPLSELVQCSNEKSICDELRRTPREKMIKLKLRALAMKPTLLYTAVAPILDSERKEIGNILVCTNTKDNLHEYRNYISDYATNEICESLSVISKRKSISPQDAVSLNFLHKFTENNYVQTIIELSHGVATDWEWTNVEQLIGKGLSTNLSRCKVVVDPLFPQTLYLSPFDAKAIRAVSTLIKERSVVSFRVLNPTGNVFSLSVSIRTCDSNPKWSPERVEELLRPFLKNTLVNIYFSSQNVELRFPCQIATILDDTSGISRANLAVHLSQARAAISSTVNVVTLIKNMADQYNLSLILLKTMFVTLANVQERADLECRLTARPCEVDVVICDSEWLCTAREILLTNDHGAIIIPIMDSEIALSYAFKFTICMPMVARDLLQMMIEVGKVVSEKKSAATVHEERERILTLRHDSPWTKGRLLGRGSYGAVYEATSDMTGGKMAVKMFYFSADREDLSTNLLNEIKIMCSLNHPNIVHYFYCERKDSDVSLFMELCDASLTDVILRRYPKPPKLSVIQIIKQVLAAIEYLHSRGIAHRDIKPQNILVKGEKIKLTDFGTARQGGATRGVQGTFRYMAPEVYKGQPHSLPCDIWSIGCLVCEFFACPPKFMDHASLLGEMTSPSVYLEDVPPNVLFRDFIYNCIRLDPEKRSTSQELLSHPFLTSSEYSPDPERMSTIFDEEYNTNQLYTGKQCVFSISST
ncbi:unnamed protein product [Phytomonas sp. Hart1]|nr:unnamed protein product [Phytomonas sp. Hart1]|eukprot:CCW70698.1 unnamed protein product [Phytomonas sp. isolate Hart1]